MKYSEFWLYYLQQHQKPTTRALHYVGTLLGVSIVTAGIVMNLRPAIYLGFVFAYLLAWIGHFGFEKNRPATFRYPLWSFISDFRMLYCFLTGSLGSELARAQTAELEKENVAALNGAQLAPRQPLIYLLFSESFWQLATAAF